MHSEILSPEQVALLPMIAAFKREYYLVGGTAIALHIGHRRSIDFDLFKFSSINHKKNLEKISSFHYNAVVTRRVEEQMNLIINDVKITFFEYPFSLNVNSIFENYIKMPSLLDLAAMKSYALGRRSKWKDYVDLYFLIHDYFSIKEISDRALEIFGILFSEKLFRSQLCYFEDVDYSESVDYLIDAPSNEDIQRYLVAKSVDLN